MWMLAPAAATVIALAVLVGGLRSVAQAAAELSRTMRRSSATAVAGDELSRLAARLGDHAETTRASADRLRGRASRRRETAHTGEAVARAAPERSGQERETQASRPGHSRRRPGS